jgi:hypothetical protein
VSETQALLRAVRLLASAIGWLAAGKKYRALEITERIEAACDIGLLVPQGEEILDEAEKIDRGDG